MQIQWYPGHMTKTRRLIEENIKLVDIVIELLDARAPYSTKNPDIDKLANGKMRLIVLNKSDLADPKLLKAWTDWYSSSNVKVIEIIATSGKGMKEVTAAAEEMLREKIERDKARGRIYRPIRAMIVGIPNVGKSTFINTLVGKGSTKTGDKPGVTRGKQWVKIKKGFELLDMPGILWPKFEDEIVGLNLAFTGAIKDEIMDTEELALKLVERLQETNPEELMTRYKLTRELAMGFLELGAKRFRGKLEERYKLEITDEMTPYDMLLAIGNKRGFITPGGGVDENRTALVILDEYRSGKIGKITVESPTDLVGEEGSDC